MFAARAKYPSISSAFDREAFLSGLSRANAFCEGAPKNRRPLRLLAYRVTSRATMCGDVHHLVRDTREWLSPRAPLAHACGCAKY